MSDKNLTPSTVPAYNVSTRQGKGNEDMSTDYYHHCRKCNVLGGLMTRQAWGTGNASLIDTFKFIMHHALRCGEDHLRVVSEHSWVTDGEFPNTLVDRSARLRHLVETRHIFPCSADWTFVAGPNGDRQPQTLGQVDDVNQTWIEKERAFAEKYMEWMWLDKLNLGRQWPHEINPLYTELFLPGWWPADE